MNNKVTVTGMEVTTKVGNNLYIVDTKVADPTATSVKYGTAIAKTTEALLEPVSTINGLKDNFFYLATTDADGYGKKINGEDVEYIAYDGTSTDDFNENYGTDAAVAYVDYVFTIKAVNASTAKAQNVLISSLTMTYADNETNGIEAFRVALLVEEYDKTAYKAMTTNTILGSATSNYFTVVSEKNQAVSDTDTLSDVVNYGEDAVIGQVSKAQDGETAISYFAVTVRLWLEGEDQKCTSDTFAALTDKWALDLEISMVDSDNTTTLPVNKITAAKTDAKVDLSTGYTADSTNTKEINGVTYYNLKKSEGATQYWTNDATFASTSRVYKITNNVYVTDVTYQCKLPAAN